MGPPTESRWLLGWGTVKSPTSRSSAETVLSTSSPQYPAFAAALVQGWHVDLLSILLLHKIRIGTPLNTDAWSPECRHQRPAVAIIVVRQARPSHMITEPSSSPAMLPRFALGAVECTEQRVHRSVRADSRDLLARWLHMRMASPGQVQPRTANGLPV